MRRLALALVLSLSTPATAQEKVLERSAKGPPDTDIRVGLYVNIQPDCTSGPLPTIRLVSPPEHGKVTVKRGKVNAVNATNYKQCLSLQVPAFVAVYRSAVGFAGTDALTLEIRFPSGRTESHKITVTIAGSGPERI